MTPPGAGAPLPPSIENLIAKVLEVADLRLVEGRREVERELRAHFEDGLRTGATAEELMARFGDPVAAGRRIARTMPRAAERTRGETGRWWMSPKEWWTETRRATRRLGRARGFAVLVVSTLALGVGANTAIFTVISSVLLDDLPYAEPDRLVRVYESHEEYPTRTQFLRAPVVAEYRTWDEVFASFGALYTYREVGADLTDGPSPQRINVVRVSSGYFETLGAAPALGRTFTDDESFGPGEATSTTARISDVAILSHRLWVDQYGANPDLVGSTIHLDGTAFEVVGIMPEGFNNPFGAEAHVWVPQDLRPGGSNGYGNYYLSAVARLRDGLTVEAAQERVRTLSRGYAEAQPDVEGAFPRLIPLQADVVGSTRRSMILILAGAAALVLLTACVNVANLLFARGLSQDRDLALRSALGSGRGRLLTGILTENGILAAAGGVFGLALGSAGVKLLLHVAPDALPAIASLETDGRVFLFGLAVTGVALLAFGLTPAMRLSRVAPAEVLRSGDRSSTRGKAVRRVRDGLIVVQIAAALVLVAGAVLLARSFQTLLDQPLGVEAEGVLTYEVHLPQARYPDGEARHAFHEQLQDRVADLPGVETVGATSWLPVSGRYHSWVFYWDLENPDGSNDEAWYDTDVRVIAGDYLGSMGIELVNGTDLLDADLEAEPMVWVNRSLVDEVLTGRPGVGERIWVADDWRRVMGIVEDIPYGARGETSRKVYVPHAQYAGDRNWALIQTVKARGDLAALRQAIRSEVHALDAQLVLYRPTPFREILRTVRIQDRFAVMLMGTFALLALVLSVVGTYGVLAASVAGRTREFGIRMALGADRESIRGMVLKYALRLTVPGVALGVVAAWVASRWIEALLFGVKAVDPVTYAGAVTIFLLVGILAGWLPARRATRVDTVEALGAE
jgi:predicted permease